MTELPSGMTISEAGGLEPPAPRPRRHIWPWVILGVVLSFTLGVIGSPWLETRVRSYLPQGSSQTWLQVRDSRVEGLRLRIEELEAKQRDVSAVEEALAAQMSAGSAPALAARVDALEATVEARQVGTRNVDSTLHQLEGEIRQLRDQAGGGDARMQDLFLLSVLRRIVESGRPLGDMEAILNARFRSRDASAVEALLTWSNQPQSRQTLAARITRLRETMPPRPEQAVRQGWWVQLKMGLGGLVRAHDPTQPDDVLDRDNFRLARTALHNGDLGYAIARLEKEQRSADVRQWLADARVLQAAELALDRLDSISLREAMQLAAEQTATAAD